jgi:hypothetical protein
MNANPITQVMLKLADINASYLRDIGKDIPALLAILPRTKDKEVSVISLDAISEQATRDAVADAAMTLICLEGYIAAMPMAAPMPDPDEVPNHPDARHCLVYFAQAANGMNACGVQYILKPEHGRATLSPLKVLSGHTALINRDIADLVRPGRARRDMH